MIGTIRIIRNFAILSLIFGASPVIFADSLLDVVQGDHRLEKNVMRDVYRNPYETLSFFGVREDMTVLESWPGGGWYSEILAPYLKGKGSLIAATYDRNPSTQKKWQASTNKGYDDRYVADKETYGDITLVSFAPETGKDIATPGSVDMVLDFRNAHNWIQSAPDAVPAAWHKALKKGGILGIVDHRLNHDQSYNPKNGYVHVQQIIDIMNKHGFEFVEKSSINRNLRDTRDHPQGVWTLPPTLAMKDEHKNKYLAIGESDRMVIKFRKL